MKISFVMLMGHQIIEFRMLCGINLFFSFKPHKNIRKLIVLFSSLCAYFGLWCEFFACGLKHCLVGSIKSFWVWVLLTSIWLYIYHYCVTAIKVESWVGIFENIFWWKGRHYSRWYYTFFYRKTIFLPEPHNTGNKAGIFLIFFLTFTFIFWHYFFS